MSSWARLDYCQVEFKLDQFEFKSRAELELIVGQLDSSKILINSLKFQMLHLHN